MSDTSHEDDHTSFHSLSASSSSFHVVPSSELPSSTRAISHDGSLSGNAAASWDYSAFRDDFSMNGSIQPSTSSSTLKQSSTKSHFRASSSIDTTTLSTPKPLPLPPTPSFARVSKREVWKEIILSSNGRDKALKLIQYSLRVFLFFHLKSTRLLGHPNFAMNLVKRFKSTYSGLSLARKCLILFNWLTPLLQITNPPPLPYTSSPLMSPSGSVTAKKAAHKRSLLHRFLHTSPPVLIDFFNSLADDTYTFSKLGLFPTSVGNRADKAANILWLVATLVGLVELGAEEGMVKSLMDDLEGRIYDVEMDPVALGRGMGKTSKAGYELRPSGKPNNVDLSVGVEEADEGLEKLRKQFKWLQVSKWKLIMDLIFVSYEVFKIKRLREPMMAISGLMSGILSSMKLYDKHYSQLAKANLDEVPL
ncbi:hypothetical protein FRC03_003914 [Tulasnella sp. 419]|nr:hypothetical protein FRC03_003914 [Tulasnella sp. 419]